MMSGNHGRLFNVICIGSLVEYSKRRPAVGCFLSDTFQRGGKKTPEKYDKQRYVEIEERQNVMEMEIYGR